MTDEQESNGFRNILLFVGNVIFYVVVGVLFVCGAVLKGPLNRVRRDTNWHEDR